MILAVLQARMSSTRLPGKVLADLCGAPMIARQIERVRRAERIDRLVVATSEEPADDPLAALVETLGVPVFRGSLTDVLGRFAGAVAAFGPAEHVVRLTADCPLADPAVIDAVIARHLETGADYTSNVLEHRTFPVGLDAEVIRAGALAEAAAEATDPHDHEHVTPFLYRQPHRYRLAGLTQTADEGEVRWTVDCPDDLAFVRAVYDALYPADPDFTSDAVRAFVLGRSDLRTQGGDRRV